MSSPAPPQAPKPVPGPLAPPAEQFWEKYSPHYEFPLSSVGSVAMHIAALVFFLGAMWLLARLTISDKTPVPMYAMSVHGDGDAAEGKGSGGGAPEEDVTPFDRPQDPKRPVPDKNIDPVVKDELKEFFPKVPSDADAPRVEDLKLPQQMAKINDDLRKKLLQGRSGKKGSGEGAGTGTSGVGGAGSGTSGDPTSSQSRAVRWELIFKTENGRDYVNQLAAMKATIVVPQPPDWKTVKAFSQLRREKPPGESFSMDKMPGLYFVDDDPGSASRVAETIGLEFGPPLFIAFFPKDIEEELASKERNYRGRKEGEIFSTKFRILIRDGQPSITVIDQTPVRR